MKFKLSKKFRPAGDQSLAIEKLSFGVKAGKRHQVLLGVTGSGKTFTIANVIAKVQKPTLVIAHNKTLAAQLCQEFREFFPDNAVEYFVSYYDYYQPEAYMPTTDTYIEKDADINEEIDRLRHAATAALLSRKDVIIVASVSCIYGLGSPEEYQKSVLCLTLADKIDRFEFINKLVDLYYERNDTLVRGTFRVKANNIDIIPSDRDLIYRIEIRDNIISKIIIFDKLTRCELKKPKNILIFPAKHFVVAKDNLKNAIKKIFAEMDERVAYFQRVGKVTEAERIERRTRYDLELLQEIGYCKGIENYSRYLTNRVSGETPYTLLDYFPPSTSSGQAGYLTVIDESHATIPQIGGMFEGDKSRKKMLIDYGFRLPSAYDNRPLKFAEFARKTCQNIYTSATPAKYELAKASENIIEQIIRPTGLVDPQTIVRPIEDQVQDVMLEIEKETSKNNRVLVTTLTKKMAEDLAKFLQDRKIRAQYLHSEVETLDRIRILKELRQGKFDCLVGVNLLREGLDLPEVSLVAILDADKEGFLRSDTSLIQTIGRAARNVFGRVILYADEMTGSIKRALDETNRRRKIQLAYNKKYHITPKTIEKEIKSIVVDEEKIKLPEEFIHLTDIADIPKLVKQKEKEMSQRAKALEFEEAALIRDEIIQLKKLRIR